MILKYDLANDEQKKKIPYLDNKLGIIDADECLEKEHKISAYKAMELLSSKKLESMPLNSKTLCYIHKTLFEDVYPWAGEYRTCNIQKGETFFFNAEFLGYGMNEFFDNLKKDGYLRKFTYIEFVELFGYYANELNFLHPFREGNGRSKKIFLTELARRAGFEIDFSQITHEQLRQAEVMASGVGTPKVRNLGILKQLYLEHIVDKRDTVFKPNIKTIEGAINRILWIYDRESAVNWMSNHKNLTDGEEDVKRLLKTQDGREEIYKLLTNCEMGAKPNSALKIIKKLKQQIKDCKYDDVATIEY